MSKNAFCWIWPCLLALSAPAALGQSQDANAEARAHVEEARRLAGTDVTAPFNFYCVPGEARNPRGRVPALEPVKLFDNLYAVGHEDTTVYALTTTDGIILIDSAYGETVETVLVPGLRALGLDPADVRYVLLGHGHADHFGGASYFQDQFDAQVGAGAADWDLIERAAANLDPGERRPPTRDLIIRDGVPLTLGDVTVTPVLIPGHTPGSMAFIFPVREGETTRMAGLFGGTMLSTFLRSTSPQLEGYIGSIEKYLEVAEAMNVEVEVQNHPVFDDTPARLARLKARAVGDEHPFVMANEAYLRFWSVIAECMRAEVAGRE